MIINHEIYYPLYTDKEHFIILVTGGRGCEHPDTEVIMADLTTKKIKDVKVGDYVMGDDFTPRLVLHTCSGTSEMYRVSQTSAEDYYVNSEHILTLKKSEDAKREKGNLTKAGTYRRPNGRYPEYEDVANINVCDFASKSKRFREHFRGFKAGSIPYPQSEVLIEPYMLGLWLGDGTAIFPNITNKDSEVIEWVKDYCIRHHQNFNYEIKNGIYMMRIVGDGKKGHNEFLNSLNKYKLIGNKHIPQEYISNSEQVRLELLAGIIDTDGHMERNGYEIIQKDESLARQIKFIADTLGFRTSMNSKKASCNGKDCGFVYRVLINGDVWRIPCKIKRKIVKKENSHKNKDWRLSQVSVTSVGIGEWCGIQIDGNHRYLHADGTVTHNSGKSFGIGDFIQRLSFELKRRGFPKSEADKIVHKILYTRYTMTSASISVIPEFLEKIELDGTTKYFHTTKTDIVNKMTGSRIMFRGIKTSSGNQTAKLKSIHGITTFVCDEAEEWTSDREFETIAFSIRQPGIQNRIIIIMNPTDSNHFIYQKYIKDTHKIVYYDGVPVQISTHPQVLHIHTTYLDNIKNLSEEFIKQAQEMKKRNPERYAHIFMGQWADVAEGAVFKKWGIVNEFPKNCKNVARGLDFGYSNDVSACVKCGILNNDLYIDEQFYKTGMLSSELIKALNEDDSFVFADSADPRLIDEIALGGVIIYPVAKPAGSIIAGIEKMKSFDNIYVTKRSLNVQEELRNYVWDKDKDGNFINIPIDAFNHCFTGDTPITTMRGQVSISKITTNDFVLTSNGYKRVEKVFNNGFKKILHIRLIFANLVVELKGTPGHKIKTVDGWKQLQELTKGDVLYLCKPLMGKSTHYTPGSDISLVAVRSCTVSSGNTTMESYPKVATSIIKMGIHTTTSLKILSLWNVANICRNTLRKTITRLKNLLNRAIGWITPVNLRINGIVQKRASFGIENTEKRLPKISSQLNILVNGVERNLCPNQPEAINSAQTDVKQNSDTIQASITKQECANNVGKNLLLTNTLEHSFAHADVQDCIAQTCVLKEIEIVKEDTANVFDIQVADEHEYFANGILVHNCMDATRYYLLGRILGKIIKPKKVKKSDLGIY